MAVDLSIPDLGSKFKDYRDDILGNSYTWGPVINANRIDAFTFHHSVTKPTGNWKAECDLIAKLHVEGNKWGGIGYRFVICSDGTVVYVGDLSHGGSAVANHNDHMFSAVLVGDFTKHLPTDAQIDSAHKLAKFFLTQMPQYPNLASWDQIKGHKDFNPTACPGSSWPNDMRDRIINNIPYTPAPTPPPAPSDPHKDCQAEIKRLNAETKILRDRIKELEAQEPERHQSLVPQLKDLVNKF
jgi:hypothetical protein